MMMKNILILILLLISSGSYGQFQKQYIGGHPRNTAAVYGKLDSDSGSYSRGKPLIDSVYMRNDSVFYRAIGVEYFAFEVGGGGGAGTVTSVATSFGLAGGTITSSGTLYVDTVKINTKRAFDSLKTYLAAQPWFDISEEDIDKWNDAYSWGDHDGLYQPVFSGLTSSRILKWNGTTAVNSLLSDDGASTITATGRVFPEADNTRNLGASGFRWANLFATTLNISAANAAGDVLTLASDGSAVKKRTMEELRSDMGTTLQHISDAGATTTTKLRLKGGLNMQTYSPDSGAITLYSTNSTTDASQMWLEFITSSVYYGDTSNTGSPNFSFASTFSANPLGYGVDDPTFRFGTNLNKAGNRKNTSMPAQYSQYEHAFPISGFGLSTEWWEATVNALGDEMRWQYRIRSWYAKHSYTSYRSSLFDWNDDSTAAVAMSLDAANGILNLYGADPRIDMDGNGTIRCLNAALNSYLTMMTKAGDDVLLLNPGNSSKNTQVSWLSTINGVKLGATNSANLGAATLTGDGNTGATALNIPTFWWFDMNYGGASKFHLGDRLLLGDGTTDDGATPVQINAATKVTGNATFTANRYAYNLPYSATADTMVVIENGEEKLQIIPAGGGGSGIELTDLSATSPIAYNNTTGVFSFSGTSDDIPEGSTNLYLTGSAQSIAGVKTFTDGVKVEKVHPDIVLNSTDGNNARHLFYANNVLKWQLGMDVTDAGVSDFYIYDQVNNKTKFFIDVSGNVRIGNNATSTPTLSANDDGNVSVGDGNLTVTNENPYLSINSTGSGANNLALYFLQNNNLKWQIGMDYADNGTADFYLYQQGLGPKIYINAAGDMKLGGSDAFSTPSLIALANGNTEVTGTLKVGSVANDNTEDKLVVWNSTDKVFEYRTVASLPSSGGATDFTDLGDVPSSYTGEAGKAVRVNATEDGLEFHALVKADVGLGNVDNTSDAGKPVSTAQQAALDLKLNLSGGTMTGHLLFTDATYDIGASGATRPRHVYASGNGVFGSSISSSLYYVGNILTMGNDGSGNLYFGNSASWTSTQIFGNQNLMLTADASKLTVETWADLKEIAAPSTPASGRGSLYVKSSDSKLYFKSDGGTEYDVTGSDKITVAKYITEETPSGTINGSNGAFTLANTPVTGSVILFLNGMRLKSGGGNDWTISGSTITMLQVPQTGDVLLATYISQ